MASEVNDAKLQEFLGKVVSDVGAAMSAALVVIGDKLGLYQAMAGRARSRPRSSPSAPRPPSATSASG